MPRLRRTPRPTLQNGVELAHGSSSRARNPRLKRSIRWNAEADHPRKSSRVRYPFPPVSSWSNISVIPCSWPGGSQKLFGSESALPGSNAPSPNQPAIFRPSACAGCSAIQRANSAMWADRELEAQAMTVCEQKCWDTPSTHIIRTWRCPSCITPGSFAKLAPKPQASIILAVRGSSVNAATLGSKPAAGSRDRRRANQ